MGIQGIGANGYPMSYMASRTEKNKPEEEMSNQSWKVKSDSHDGRKGGNSMGVCHREYVYDGLSACRF